MKCKRCARPLANPDGFWEDPVCDSCIKKDALEGTIILALMIVSLFALLIFFSGKVR